MKKATRQQTKTHNSRLVLKTIYQRGSLSRADIARATRLTRPTVSNIVAELMADGLVDEIGHGQSQGGKPPILLSVVAHSHNIIGIDLGNSEFRGGIFDLRGSKLHSLNLPINGQVGEMALNLVYALIDQLLPRVNSPVLGIGIGTPGITDTAAGIIYEAVNLGWSDLPLRDLLVERYDVPVHVANDSQAAALGEFSFGHGEKASNLVVVKAGSGISAGIVLNGRIYSGDHASPGEIGHIATVPSGKLCTCSRHGCLETVASSRAIIEGAQAIVQAEPESIMAQLVTSPEEITTDLVLQAFEADDTSVHVLIANVGRYLGTAVAHLVSILSIEHLIIGGRISRFGDVLLTAVRNELNHSVLTRIAQNTHIELSVLGADIVILGAAALVLARELGVV
ncbi:MAG: ROK family protein [Chloroflexi bacterium]|nr:ROK family protein [Chloroflexota bacterium]